MRSYLGDLHVVPVAVRHNSIYLVCIAIPSELAALCSDHRTIRKVRIEARYYIVMFEPIVHLHQNHQPHANGSIPLRAVSVLVDTLYMPRI